MLLHRGGTGVAAQSYVTHYNFPHVNIVELKRNGIKSYSGLVSGIYKLSFKSTVILTFSIGPGQLLPVASTGMSSYFSKLIPVLLPENSSLRASSEERQRERE